MEEESVDKSSSRKKRSSIKIPKKRSVSYASASSAKKKLSSKNKAKALGPRWQQESRREKSKTDSKGKLVGFGSFFKRPFGRYSEAEFMAPMGHPDRIRTIDCKSVQIMERQAMEDDSDLETDWYERSSIRRTNSEL